MIAYVVAWEYGPDNAIQGGGFDWYFTEKEADIAFVIEQENERELADENWKAYRFTREFSDDACAWMITEQIDSVLVEMVGMIKELKSGD